MESLYLRPSTSPPRMHSTQFGYVLAGSSETSSSLFDMNDLPYMSQARSMLLIVSAMMFFTAFCVYMPLGNIQADYHGKCFLNSEVVFEKLTDGFNYSDQNVFQRQRLNPVATIWGPTFNCNFTTFTPVMVAILSMVIAWSTFTVWPTMMEIGKGGVLMLVYAFFFSLCLGACIASAVMLINGYAATCADLEQPEHEITCEQLSTEHVRFKAEGEPVYVDDVHRAILIAKVASAALIGLSILQIILAFGTFGIIWFHFHLVNIDSESDFGTIDDEDMGSGSFQLGGQTR